MGKSPTQPTAKAPVVVQAAAVTPHNRALYEAGKSMLIDSINTGRTFCQFMITLSSGAVPIYLGLLKFVLPDKYTLSFNEGAVAIIPAVLFLISSVVFVLGYYPQHGQFSLDIPEEIEKERTITIQKRKKLTHVGFGLFILGNIIAVVILTLFLGKTIPETAANTQKYDAGKTRVMDSLNASAHANDNK